MRALRLALGIVAVPFGLLGYHLLVRDLHSSPQNAVASVVVAWTFIAAGLLAWARRPESREDTTSGVAGCAGYHRLWKETE